MFQIVFSAKSVGKTRQLHLKEGNETIFLHHTQNTLKTVCCCFSVTKLCLTLCNPMDGSTPGFPVLYYLTESAQTHVQWVGDTIQPSDKDLYLRPETVKRPEENLGNRLSDIGLSNIFLDLSPQASVTTTKINRDYNKPESFCTDKETNNKTERQPTDWEKIFANTLSEKGVISKILTELIQLILKKNQFKIGHRTWTDIFTKDSIQIASGLMASGLMKRWSTSQII